MVAEAQEHSSDKHKELSAWFLGPKAENADMVEQMVLHILRDYFHWRRNYYPADKILITQHMRREHLDWSDSLFQQVCEMVALLKRHFPFYSPRYIAHMLSEQTIPSVLGYFAGMLYNPNNVTREAAPVTVEWELEVGRDLLNMLGYHCPPEVGPDQLAAKAEFGWAHITSGGTVANLEALWVARTVRYFPLAVKYAAQQAGIAIQVKLPHLPPDQPRLLSELDDRQCLGLKPNEAIYLLPHFIEAVKHHFDLSLEMAGGKAWELLQHSGWSIPHSGTQACFGKFPPAIFVSGAAHYSIAKAADVLGFGQDQVILVDVDSRFRLDLPDLERKIKGALQRGLYPLAVIGIAGTTEEGAVDPIDKMCEFRERLEQETGFSFWLHVDAAWGSYIRSIFAPGGCHHTVGAEPSLAQSVAAIHQFTRRDLTIQRGRYSASLETHWSNKDVCSAFLAFPQAESITLDPHKMGYIPYPCGAVAFRNDRVRHFLTQKAPYISASTPANVQAYGHQAPSSVGPFILEGSKPGAAVAACWLSHRMIPPTRDGYGVIVRASLLGARELYERLIHWEPSCRANKIDTNYQFVVVTPEPPDTNIVCFVVKEKTSHSLKRMNLLTRLVYEKFSIQAELGEYTYSYAQPFFLSRTTFELPNYSAGAVQEFLARADVDAEAYAEQGILVLRATVMTPYIVLSTENNRQQEYLAEFMEALAQATVEATRRLYQGESVLF